MEKDTSRLVAELAGDLLKQIILNVRAQIFIGPSSAMLTKKEAMTALSTPDQRLAALDALGADELLSQVEKLGV